MAVEGAAFPKVDGKFRAAVGAGVKHVLKALQILSVFVFYEELLLLPVGIKQQCFLSPLPNGIQVQLRQLFLAEQLVDIQGGSAGTESGGPFGHGKIGTAGFCHVHIHPQPLKQLIGGGGNGRGQTVLAHQTGGVNDHRLTGLNHRPNLLQISHSGLKLLLGNHCHLVQDSLDGQTLIEGIADDKGHGPLAGADEIDKIIGGLVIGNDNKGAFSVSDFISKELSLKNTARHDTGGCLGKPVI